MRKNILCKECGQLQSLERKLSGKRDKGRKRGSRDGKLKKTTRHAASFNSRPDSLSLFFTPSRFLIESHGFNLFGFYLGLYPGDFFSAVTYITIFILHFLSHVQRFDSLMLNTQIYFLTAGPDLLNRNAFNERLNPNRLRTV